jgi:GH24 family phage-related lysozyme (muramidase)
MKIKSAKSIANLIKKAKGQQSQRRAKKGKSDDNVELLELMRLQAEAFEAEVAKAQDGGVVKKGRAGIKGLQKAWETQQEFKQAKTGVKSRYGNIAKAFGLTDEKGAMVIDKMFGKKIDEAELKKMREKFKIGEKGEKAKAAKAEKKEKSANRDKQLEKILNLSEKIHSLLGGMKSSIDGIANKLRASPAKEVPQSKKEMRKMEKQAGLKYSKETGRYKDVKSGRFVGKEQARQRMNISPTAAKAEKPEHTLESKILEVAPTATKEKDPNAEKLDEIKKDAKQIKKNSEDILENFSLKPFYKLIGGAIGAFIPVLKKAIEWLWDIGSKGVKWVMDIVDPMWDKFREYMSDIKLDIPKIMDEFTVMGYKIGPIGGFTFEPFKFLKKPTEGPKESAGAPAPAPAAAPEAPAPAAAPEAATPAGGGAPTPEAPTPAAPAPTPAAPTPAAPTPTPTAPTPAAPAPAAPTSAAPAPTATPSGSNMPGAAPPPTGKKTAASGGDYRQMALDFLTKEEGFPKGGKAYWDPPGQNNLVSVGYGHQIKDSEYQQGFIDAGGEKIPIVGSRGIDTVMSKEQGKALLAADLGTYEQKAKGPLKDQWDTLAPAQKAALISYAYNTGTTRSLVKRGLGDAIAKNDAKAGGEIIATKGIQTAGGKPFPPLVKRRATEGALFASAGSATSPVSAASGGVATGPTSGYPATLHGKEAIIPLNAQTPASKAAVSAVSKAINGEDMSKDTTAVASNSSAPTVVPVPVGGGGGGQKGGATKQNQGTPMNASVRHQDNAFVRAIAKDFSHPSTFTSVTAI